MSQPTAKPENPYTNLIFNIVIPSILLMKGEKWLGTGPATSLLLALAFPFGYGAYDLIRRKTWNILSIIGLISILLTGGIGLLTLPTEWIAFKEAAVPSFIGLVVLGSLKTRYPLIKTLLFNEKFFRVADIQQALNTHTAQSAFNALLKKATIALSGTFFVSGLLNFILAKYFVTSPSGTAAFTEELGRMTLWSYPVILLPSMLMLMAIMWWLLKSLNTLTGIPLEDLFIDHTKTQKSNNVQVL